MTAIALERPARALDLEAMWPDAFDGLDAIQRRAVVQACAANWHEGWQPNRPDVANLCDYAAGRITGAEYERRGLALVNARYPATGL